MKAQLGDLFSPWVGTRGLLLYGRNPYGPEVSHEIQLAFYGRVITQRYDQPAEQLIDEQRFAYPLYVVFLLAPTVHVAFADAQTWALVVLVILTAASVPLWLDVLHWRLSKMTSAGLNSVHSQQSANRARPAASTIGTARGICDRLGPHGASPGITWLLRGLCSRFPRLSHKWRSYPWCGFSSGPWATGERGGVC